MWGWSWGLTWWSPVCPSPPPLAPPGKTSAPPSRLCTRIWPRWSPPVYWTLLCRPSISCLRSASLVACTPQNCCSQWSPSLGSSGRRSSRCSSSPPKTRWRLGQTARWDFRLRRDIRRSRVGSNKPSRSVLWVGSNKAGQSEAEGQRWIFRLVLVPPAGEPSYPSPGRALPPFCRDANFMRCFISWNVFEIKCKHHLLSSTGLLPSFQSK